MRGQSIFVSWTLVRRVPSVDILQVDHPCPDAMTLSFAKLQHELRETYRDERELGVAGTSRVLAAEELAFGRPVAVQVLPPELAGEMSLERFRRELVTAARRQQANIVPVHSAGNLDGEPWYAMPFIEGRSLRDGLTEAAAPLPVTEIVGIARDVSRALATRTCAAPSTAISCQTTSCCRRAPP